MVAAAIYSVTMVLWKKLHFLFAEPWKGIEKGMLLLQFLLLFYECNAGH